MDGGAFGSTPVQLPGCLLHLKEDRRWVGWRWEERKGRRTKPPLQVHGGKAGGYARNDDPETWTTLDEAQRAFKAGGLDGIGLQLLGLAEFAAIDLDDVRDAETGELLPWAARVVDEAASYAEVTPSAAGLRVLGAVGLDHPPIHTKREHAGGGSFEVYANVETGRYITITGRRLECAPDALAPLAAKIEKLLDAEGGDRRRDPVAEAFRKLPDWLRSVIAHGRSDDRSADFQSAVNGLHARVASDVALGILRRFPDGPAGKYAGRLDAEFDRSWGKAAASRRPTGGAEPAGEATEDGVARLLIERHGQDLRHDHDVGAWFGWTGDRWLRDGTQQTLQQVREIAREVSEDLEKGFATVRKSSFASGAEKLARGDRAVAVRQDVWDAEQDRLGVPGGSVDLDTGRMDPPDRAHLISRQAAVAPAEDADCPTWRRFLDDATGGDAEFVAYLQRLVGYVLTGDTREHLLVFIHGSGGNGKSVFLNTVAGILGDYAATAPMDAFTSSRSDRHPTELAMLNGARLVTASETESGHAWAEARIKQLTGGDPISARFMRQDFFTFLPRFKLVIVGNHKPVLRNVDDAARRRFHVVPFVLKPARPDKLLEAKLRSEWPEILRWAIDGCLAWRADGLNPPPAIVAETEAYFGEQDLIGQWLEDCCIADPANGSRWEAVADLYKSWSEFCDANGERPGSQKAFGDLLDKRGFKAARRKPGGVQVRVRLGLTLLKHEAREHWSASS